MTDAQGNHIRGVRRYEFAVEGLDDATAEKMGFVKMSDPVALDDSEGS